MNNINYIFLLFLLPSCINFNNFDRGYLQNPVEAVVIPFETYRGLIIIPAKVNGVPGKFLFDNGASYSCVNQDFADKAKINFKSGAKISDGNNRKTQIKEATADDISIEEVHFINTGVYLIDTKQFFPCNDEIDGIIGASIINKVNWSIDFQQEQIEISSSPFENEGLVFDIGFSSNNSTFISFRINDQDVRAKVDFGYQGELKLRAKEYQNHFSGLNAIQNIGISSLSISGLGKSDTTYQIREGINMTHKGESLPFPPAVNLTKNLKYSARLGTDFFRNYEVIINSSQKKYLLAPIEKGTENASYKNYGLAIYEVEGIYRIIQVNPQQIADFPIEVMDEVADIDGESVAQFNNHCEMRAYMAEKIKKQETLYLRLQGQNEDWEFPYIEAPVIPIP